MVLLAASKVSLRPVRMATTPRAKVWHIGPKSSNGDRVFSRPWQARRKFAKWLDGLAGTSGRREAISAAFSFGMISRVAPWLPPLKVSSLE